jgi:serine/threonine-protein kinase RsbW
VTNDVSVQSTRQDLVELTFQGSVGLVVLARFTAATVAVQAGFSVEEIDDLRLAVDELCVSFGPVQEHGRVQLEFDRRDDTVHIVCRFEARPAAADDGRADGDEHNWDENGDLSQQILNALVDEHGREVTDGRPCAWLRKKRGAFDG